MRFIERVAILQQQLDADIVADREAAEKELIAMGVEALNHLEPLSDQASTEARERMERVRQALETLAVESVTQPGRVKLSGKLSLEQALQQLQKQTRNRVELIDQVTPDFGEQTIDFGDSDQASNFWKALNLIRAQANVEVDAFASDQGLMRLSPRRPEQTGNVGNLPTSEDGIFQTTVTRVTAARNLLNPQLDNCTFSLRVQWEPRVTPISISLPGSSIKLVDEFDRVIEISNPEAKLGAMVQSEIPEVEFHVSTKLIDRQVEELKSFSGTLETVLPGRNEVFKFKNLGRLGVGAKQTKAGVTVAFNGIQKNEQLFGLMLSIKFDDAKQGMESHYGWVFENKVALITEDGEQLLPLATESMGQTENETRIKYYFDRDPAPLTLVYETPAAIVSVPIKFSLSRIPLP